MAYGFQMISGGAEPNEFTYICLILATQLGETPNLS